MDDEQRNEQADTRRQLEVLYTERQELYRDDRFEPGTYEAAKDRLDRAIERLEALMEIDYQQMTQLARALNLLSDPFRPVTA